MYILVRQLLHALKICVCWEMPLFFLDNFMVNTKTAASSDSPIATHPMTQIHVPEDLHLQQHSCESYDILYYECCPSHTL